MPRKKKGWKLSPAAEAKRRKALAAYHADRRAQRAPDMAALKVIEKHADRVEAGQEREQGMTYGERTMDGERYKPITRLQFIKMLDTAFSEGDQRAMSWAKGVQRELNMRLSAYEKELSELRADVRYHKRFAQLLLEKYAGPRTEQVG